MDERTRKILIVDDEDLVREVLKRILATRGYEVIEAVNGQEGLDAALAEMPDLVLTDLRMPVRDGVWLIRALRGRRVFDPVPILIVSSVSEPENIQEGLREGASDYVTKPFMSEELIARIDANLRSKVLFDELRRERDELQIVLEIMKDTTDSLHLAEVLYRLTQRLAPLIRADRCSVILTDPMERVGWVVATRENPAIRSHEVKLADYPEILKAIRTREAVVVGCGSHPELDQQLEGVMSVRGVGSILVVPLISQGSVLGVLFARTSAGTESANDHALRKAKIVAFAAAGAIRNAKLYEDATAEAPANLRKNGAGRHIPIPVGP